MTANAGLAVYFADHHSPWQRGTNENTNRPLRQYFPKGVSIAALTHAGSRSGRPYDIEDAARGILASDLPDEFADFLRTGGKTPASAG